MYNWKSPHCFLCYRKTKSGFCGMFPAISACVPGSEPLKIPNDKNRFVVFDVFLRGCVSYEDTIHIDMQDQVCILTDLVCHANNRLMMIKPMALDLIKPPGLDRVSSQNWKQLRLVPVRERHHYFVKARAKLEDRLQAWLKPFLIFRVCDNQNAGFHVFSINRCCKLPSLHR